MRRSHAPHRQQCLSPRQRWRSSTSSTSTLFFPSHHPLHVSHITARPEKNVCRYLNKVDSRGRACVTITRYTCILDVTLDPPNAWIIIQTMRSTFIRLVFLLVGGRDASRASLRHPGSQPGASRQAGRAPRGPVAARWPLPVK